MFLLCESLKTAVLCKVQQRPSCRKDTVCLFVFFFGGRHAVRKHFFLLVFHFFLLSCRHAARTQFVTFSFAAAIVAVAAAAAN